MRFTRRHLFTRVRKAGCLALAVCIGPGLIPRGADGQQPPVSGMLSRPAVPATLRKEIEDLNQAMVAAFKRNPASVASFYTDDARIIGGGARHEGRAAIDAYWAQATMFKDWSLEVFDAGGSATSPWLLGRSTLTGQSDRTMVTDFLGVLRRMPDGSLKYQVDFYTACSANRRTGIENTSAGVTSPQPPRLQQTAPSSQVSQVSQVSPSSPSLSPEPRTPFNGPARTTLTTGVVDVPLAKAGQYYYVDVQMNGKPFRLTLETGAGFFAISARAATVLGLRVDSVEVSPGYRAPVTLVESLTLPGVRFDTIAARVMPLFDSFDFDGIISIAVLRDLLATIDLGASRLRLERGSLPVPNGRDVLPIAGKDRGGRVDFEMSLGKVTVPAVIDTRSYLSIIAPDSLEGSLHLGAAPRFVGNARGPSMGTFTLRGTHLATDARIGAFSVRRPGMVLRNRPGVVVGVPFIEQFAITIDQRNQRIRFARPGRAALAVIPPEDWETVSGAAGSGTSSSSAGTAPKSGPTPRTARPVPSGRPMGFNRVEFMVLPQPAQ